MILPPRVKTQQERIQDIPNEQNVPIPLKRYFLEDAKETQTN